MIKRSDLISPVVEAILHLLYDSYLPGTSLWPKQGIKLGYGADYGGKDSIYCIIHIHEPKIKPVPVFIRFNIYTKKESKILKQARHIELIMDHAMYGDIVFKVEHTHYIHTSTHILGMMNLTTHLNY